MILPLFVSLALAVEALAQRREVLASLIDEVAGIQSALPTNLRRMFTRVVGLELEDDLLFWQRLAGCGITASLSCGLNVRLATGQGEDWWAEGTTGDGDVARLDLAVLHSPVTMDAWLHHVVASSAVQERTVRALEQNRVTLRIVRGAGVSVDHVFRLVDALMHTTCRHALEAVGVGVVVGPATARFAVLPTGDVSVPWDATHAELTSELEAAAVTQRIGE